VPALFHGPELSPATTSPDSKTVTLQSGATTPSRALSVALMMPPPTSTTSGFAASVVTMFLQQLRTVSLSMVVRGSRQHVPNQGARALPGP
jgi:hypothetical protein